jgi:hypothetical protein
MRKHRIPPWVYIVLTAMAATNHDFTDMARGVISVVGG